MPLRYYQSDAIQAVYDAFKRGLKGVTIESATGTGKATIIAEIVHRAVSKGKRVLVAVNRETLTGQLVKTLSKRGLFPVLEQGQDKASPLSELVVGSIQTMQSSRLKKWAEDWFHMVITDEVHFAAASTFRNTLGYFKDAFHIGVTATLERHDKKGLCDVYQENVFTYTLRQAWDDGYLVEFEFEELPVPICVSDEVASKKMLSEADEIGVFEKDNYLPRLFSAASDRCHKAHGILFWPNCASSMEAAKHFASVGIDSRHIEGKGGPAGMTDKQIAETLEWFSQPGPKSLHNADLLSYGYDNPLVDLVGIMRLSRSIGMLKQRLGRGTRPACPVDLYETALDRRTAIHFSAKKRCRVLDLMLQLGDVKNTFADSTALITEDAEEREFLREQRKSGSTFTREDFEDKLRAKRQGDKDKALAKLAEDAANAARKAEARKFGPYIGHIMKRQVKEGWQKATPKQIQLLQYLGFNGIAPSAWHAHQLIDAYKSHREK